MEYKVKQLQPNHADHISGYKDKYIDDMITNEGVIAQPKYDGERMLIHINNGEVYCTSRRFSKKTERYMENQDKLPVLKEIFKNFKYDYTVIDCEAYSKDWSTAVGILHSLPERAIKLQEENKMYFACFDCLYFDGQDVRTLDYASRLAMLVLVLQCIDTTYVHLVDFVEPNSLELVHLVDTHCISSSSQINSMMNASIEKGFEGIVIKSLSRKYYDKAACLKCKKFETVDAVICGYQEGNGKYTGSVGAMYVGYYDEANNNVVKISKVNCGTDEEREYCNQHREELLNTVVEIKCQEVTDKSLRHPVFIRYRPDKDYKMCTKQTIFKES